MRRFLFRPEERDGDRVLLSEAESRHIKTVLRLRSGDKIELLDGTGAVYAARIVKVEKRVSTEITGLKTKIEEERISLWVGQGVLKAKKMDGVIQKCTELGVRRFTPFISSRCQGRPAAMQIRKKHERWLRIIKESCKQCCRPQPMDLIEQVSFQNVLQVKNEEIKELKLLFWEEEQAVHLRDVESLTEYNRVRILLGPEGGLSEDEVESARSAGWQTASLGQRILRAETATYASVAIVQHLIGNM